MDETGQLARELFATIERTIGITLPPDLLSAIWFHARKVGRDNAQDFASWLVLECLEAKRAGVEIDAAHVKRALSRIQKRIVRQARKMSSYGVTPPESLRTRNEPEHWADLLDLFRRPLNATELSILADALAEVPIQEIAMRHRISYRTAARRRNALLQKLWDFLRREGVV